MIFHNSESALNALKTLYKDKQDLIDYRNECDFLRAKIESIGSPLLSNAPHGSIPPGTDGDLIALFIDMQKTLHIRSGFYHEKLKAITDILDNMHMPLYSRILTCRYIKGMPWSSIANVTGYSKSHLYTLHRKALALYAATAYDYDNK